MVEKRVTESLFKLSPDVKKNLEALETQIDEAGRMIAVLKKAGMSVTELEGQLTWAKDMRTMLLTEFGD